MGNKVPLVVVIIPNYNLKEDLGECLDSLQESDYENLRILVVDNASHDNSVQYLYQNYPWVNVLAREVNGGYAAAINDGIRATENLHPEYYFVLNNDTIVLPDAISKLIQIVESDPVIGVAAPKIINHENPEKIFSLGDRIFSYLPLPVRYGLHEHDRPEYDGVMDFDYVFGCAFLIRSETLKTVGYFDISYFMFYEDADFCRRVRDTGYRIVRVGSSIVRHKASKSVSKQRPFMTYLRARNRSRFYRRYKHGPSRILTFIALSFGSIQTITRFVFSGKTALIKHYVKGAWIGFREPLPPIDQGN